MKILDAATSTGAGISFAFRQSLSRKLAYQVVGTFVGTVTIQGSIDGTTYYTLATETAPNLAVIDAYPYIRANVTAYTSGTISVHADGS